MANILDFKDGRPGRGKRCFGFRLQCQADLADYIVSRSCAFFLTSVTLKRDFAKPRAFPQEMSVLCARQCAFCLLFVENLKIAIIFAMWFVHASSHCSVLHTKPCVRADGSFYLLCSTCVYQVPTCMQTRQMSALVGASHSGREWIGHFAEVEGMARKGQVSASVP